MHEALLGGKEIPPEAAVEALVYTGNLENANTSPIGQLPEINWFSIGRTQGAALPSGFSAHGIALSADVVPKEMIEGRLSKSGVPSEEIPGSSVLVCGGRLFSQ
ncbi:hypothetical protein R1flu_014425 [Riccia fluitans]|uniref:Uncharacterized protein n=1 Tax=Riccia fluitans TaxID=41844 RepID=A0ABD1YJG2_9MARC